MNDLNGMIIETIKVGINEKDVFKPASDKDVQTRKATARELEKVRKQKVLSMEEVCPNCKVDLRTTTIKHEEKEEVVYTLFFNTTSAEWEVDDKDGFGSEHVEYRCGKCGGSLEDGKDFFYEEDIEESKVDEAGIFKPVLSKELDKRRVEYTKIPHYKMVLADWRSSGDVIEQTKVALESFGLFGDNTEMMVHRYFPEIPEKKTVLEYLKIQRERWAARNWNKGLVREY